MKLGELHVDGPPVPKLRARTTVVNGKPRTYTPKATRLYEEQIGWAWRGPKRFAGPVSITVQVMEGVTNHPGDLDNYVKSVLDGLNGVAWVDDKQIVGLHASILRADPKPGLTAVVEGWE